MNNATQEKPTVGILAYGSVISDPGEEIKNAHTKIISNVMTPFHIEFARKSNNRGGAPTLVPVTSGGAHVDGQVFKMDTSEAEAANILYRREIGKVGEAQRTYTRPNTVTTNTVLIERLTNFAGLDIVLYTKIAANIPQVNAENLAKLAIASVTKASSGLDGISYLIATKNYGIETALSNEYEAEILKETKCGNLQEALERLQAEQDISSPPDQKAHV